MNARIKISVCAAVGAIIILMVVQYLWILDVPSGTESGQDQFLRTLCVKGFYF
jgi:hypothetical protein